MSSRIVYAESFGLGIQSVANEADALLPWAHRGLSGVSDANRYRTRSTLLPSISFQHLLLGLQSLSTGTRVPTYVEFNVLPDPRTRLGWHFAMSFAELPQLPEAQPDKTHTSYDIDDQYYLWKYGTLAVALDSANNLVLWNGTTQLATSDGSQPALEEAVPPYHFEILIEAVPGLIVVRVDGVEYLRYDAAPVSLATASWRLGQNFIGNAEGVTYYSAVGDIVVWEPISATDWLDPCYVAGALPSGSAPSMNEDNNPAEMVGDTEWHECVDTLTFATTSTETTYIAMDPAEKAEFPYIYLRGILLYYDWELEAANHAGCIIRGIVQAHRLRVEGTADVDIVPVATAANQPIFTNSQAATQTITPSATYPAKLTYVDHGSEFLPIDILDLSTPRQFCMGLYVYPGDVIGEAELRVTSVIGFAVFTVASHSQQQLCADGVE